MREDHLPPIARELLVERDFGAPDEGAPGAAGDAGGDARQWHASGSYRVYVLVLLLAVYAVNFIDRTILSVLAPQIKHELRIGDTEIGILTGVAFAFFYTLLALPIARIAERRNRPAIIAGSILIWSVMTGVSGLARTFLQLAGARVLVGMGEAGSTPASQSLLADYFPPHRRATAAAVLSMGMPIGVLCGALGGGWLGQNFGWRNAMIVAGAPGLIIALLVALTVREPRALAGAVSRQADATPPSFGAVMRKLRSNRSLVHFYLGAGMLSLTAYSLISFIVLYLMRDLRLSLVQASTGFGVVHGLSAVAGMVAGGALADRAGKSSLRNYARIPAAAATCSAPLLAVALYAEPTWLAVGCFAVLAFLQYAYIGPVMGVILNAFDGRSRATAVAIFYFVLNLIGLGIGPVLVGWLSDTVALAVYSGGDGFRQTCIVAQQASLQCDHAIMTGLRSALTCLVLFYAAAALHFHRAGINLPERGEP